MPRQISPIYLLPILQVLLALVKYNYQILASY